MKTRVVNKRQSRYDVYIGRGGPWGNPYQIGPDGGRGKVIAKYRVWIMSEDRVAIALRASLHRLQGKVLGCFCAPLPCHGDVLAELADEGAA